MSTTTEAEQVEAKKADATLGSYADCHEASATIADLAEKMLHYRATLNHPRSSKLWTSRNRFRVAVCYLCDAELAGWSGTLTMSALEEHLEAHRAEAVAELLEAYDAGADLGRYADCRKAGATHARALEARYEIVVRYEGDWHNGLGGDLASEDEALDAIEGLRDLSEEFRTYWYGVRDTWTGKVRDLGPYEDED